MVLILEIIFVILLLHCMEATTSTCTGEYNVSLTERERGGEGGGGGER